MGKRRAIDENVLTANVMKKHVNDGLTDREIASIYFCSDSTIFRLRQKYGIKKHKLQFARNVDSYFRMKECNLTDEQVAYIWGISRRALSEWKKREEIDGISIQDGKVILRRGNT